MNTIMNALNTITRTASEVFSSEPTVPRSEVLAMEEKERADRIEHIAQSSINRANAKNVSSLVSATQFPYFKGGLNKGFKSYTRKAEELERQRMLASKAELGLRRQNARMLAGHVNALGWPFIRSAGQQKFILTDETKLAEEEERDRRLADKSTHMIARNNAALVSNLIRWDNYQRHTNAGLKRMTRNMEEKERKARIADKADQERAAELAFHTSGFIRRLGWPFYNQPTYDNKDMTRAIEEEEKNLRLANPHERMLAKENAGIVADLIHAKDAAFLEEKEKDRRLQDRLEQERHKAHAKKVAGIIAFQNAPQEIERKRLLADKAHSREAQLGAKKVAEMVPHFMSISSWNINRAVEKERSRRANDITAIAYAKHTAKKVSQLILDANTEKSSAWSNDLEQERIRRMHDRAASDLNKKNARKISKMISNRNNTSLSATESERARRLADTNEQQLHQNVARQLSDLVKGAPVFNNQGMPLNKPIDVEMGLPTATAVRSAPIMPEAISAPVASAAPLERSIPVEAPLSAPLQKPLEQERAVPFMQAGGSPFINQPIMQQQPTQIYSSPATMPVSYSSPSTMPITYSSPSAMPITYSSPSAMPITYSSPSAMPMTYSAAPSAVPITGYSQPMTYLPGAAPAYVPYDSAVPSHLRVMTDKERRKLEKQASKHSHRSQREARRAEHDLAKAEKLHFKGKDNRAVRYESKAEQHNIAAKHHQAWAQELAADSLSHTLPSALPTVYRPAM